MAKIEKRDIWKAEIELEIERLAFSCQYEERGKGSGKMRVVVPTNWLDADGETLLLDIGKRLKGWVKEVILTTKPSMLKKIQFGLFIKSQPNLGMNPLPLAEDGNGVATIKDIAPSKTWGTFSNRGIYQLKDGDRELPEPEVDHLISATTGTSIFRLYYILGKKVIVRGNIFCFVQIPPDSIKSWMDQIGCYKGVGDCHSAPEGYGLFTVKKFELKEEGALSF